ncbi:hypothetical protein FRC04_008540 [Tulasnella sp. 424]|nr:hypothetical protein FRC04_008540 [Tulasnella sp. 424]
METSTTTHTTFLPETNIENDDQKNLPPPQPQLEPRMLVTFSISSLLVQREWMDWPDFVEEVARMKFKRYHAYVYLSTIYDPLGLWKLPNRPPNPPPEKVRLALIGPSPPKSEYFPQKVISQHPAGPAEFCHPIALGDKGWFSFLTERNQVREPLQVEGPQCKLKSPYVYTGKRIEVIGTSLRPSARGPENRWMIANNEEDERLGDSFLEDEGKLRRLTKEYEREHPDELPVAYTMEDGKLLLDGIDHSLEFATYCVPVEFSLELESQNKIEDPCDFLEEVISIRRALYRQYKKLQALAGQAEEEKEEEEEEEEEEKEEEEEVQQVRF